MSAFGVVVAPTENAKGSSYDVRIGVGAGRVNGLCNSQHVGILGQPFTLLIKGGDSDPNTFEIVASGLILDATQAKGVIGAKDGLQVNKNGADVSLGSTGIVLGAASNRFGLQAGSAHARTSSPARRRCPAPGTGTGAGTR